MKTFITILVIAILIVLAIYYFRDSSSASGEEAVYCTMDAKLCPDGSYVGRIPPDCEFAACPIPTATSTDSTAPSYDINADINAS